MISYFNHGRLSVDIIRLILDYSDIITTGRLKSVCKLFYEDTSDVSVWSRLLERELITTAQLIDISRYDAYSTLKNWVTKKFSLSVYQNLTTGISQRYLHRAVTLPDGRVYIFGGVLCVSDSHIESYNDMWLLDMTTNTMSRVDGKIKNDRRLFAGRCATGMAYHNGYIYVFGGLENSSHFVNELWSFHIPTSTWSLLEVGGTEPAGRWGHTMITYEDYLVVYGGSNPSSVLDDLRVLHLKPSNGILEWKRIKISNTPIGRSGHCVALHGNTMYMYGGNTHGGTLTDMWKFDLGQLRLGFASCQEIIQINAPKGRIGASMYTVGNRLFMFGGRNKLAPSFLDGFFSFDVRTNTWSLVDIDLSAVAPRTGHCVFPTPTGICFFGGYLGGVNGQGVAVTNQFVYLDMFGKTHHPLVSNKCSEMAA
jgi:hypothetical protein